MIFVPKHPTPHFQLSQTRIASPQKVLANEANTHLHKAMRLEQHITLSTMTIRPWIQRVMFQQMQWCKS